MEWKITNDSIEIITNFPLFYTKYLASMYDAYNRREFRYLQLPNFLTELDNFIRKSYNQPINYIPLRILRPNTIKSNNNAVVLAFSGGLDSVYQALKLRELGYEVVLLHVANMQKYENGQALKVAKDFADKFSFKLELVKWKATPGVKEINENPVKTSICYTLCMDYCLSNNYHLISSGDDMRLNFKDCDLENNFGDCKEVTERLFKNLDFEFIPIEHNTNKAIRLQYLRDTGARDYYYSTTSPGRLVKYYHDFNEKKFGIKLDKWCSLTDRKDCFHYLLEYYYNEVDLPENLINHCWDKVAIGPDKNFFGKHLSLKKRIKNLVDY